MSDHRFWIVALLILSVGHLYSQSTSTPRDGADQKQETDKSKSSTEAKPESTKPPTPIVSSAQPQPSDKQAESKDEPASIWKKAFSPETWPNWTLASFAFVGALYARHTWIALKKQVTANERAAEAAERTMLLTECADVLIKEVKTNSGLQLRPDTMFTVWIKNYGRTRANNVFINLEMGLHPIGPELKQNEHQVRSVLGAGEAKTSFFGPMSTILTTDNFNAVLRGEKQLAFGGEITYEDVFGKSHTAKCGGIYSLSWGAFTITRNEAD